MGCFIIFCDALDRRETKGIFKKRHQAGIKDPILNVTPCVLGPIFTGKTAEEHNLIRSIKLYEQNINRPACEHLIEQVDEKIRILSHEIPFTVNVQPNKWAVVPSAPQTNVTFNRTPFTFRSLEAI